MHKKIIKLRKEISKHNYKYYISNNPEISDYEFDMKLKELEKLENEYNDLTYTTKKIGEDVIKCFPIVNHRYPMYSLNNVYSKQEVIDWETRIKKHLKSSLEYVCELKYDGISISLHYENGYLISALTRGDGIHGNEIIDNIRIINSIPLKLKGNYPYDIEVRAEIILPLIEFKKINQERIKKGKKPYVNPRNTVNGLLKQKNKNYLECLECFVYSIISNNNYNNQYYNLMYAREWGFKVPESVNICKSITSIFNYIEYWNFARYNLQYNIDGIVIKVNNYHQQAILGYTSKYPRWAIAYKFKSQRVITQILNVTFEVGRTGVVTPVAELKPIFFDGTTVKRASLYNEDIINKLDIYKSDFVIIEKGGNIIPKIIGVDFTKRTTNNKIKFINICPDCNTFLIKKNNIYYCPNEIGCYSQIIEKINHFVSRKAMNIYNIGSNTIKQLFNAKLLHTIADLYTLKVKDIMNIMHISENNAQNIIEEIEKSKKNPFYKVLYALCIPNVGEYIAKKLTHIFFNIDELIFADYDKLKNINNIGNKIIFSLKEYFSKDYNILIINKLKKNGIKLKKNDI
ncbi:MAG: NAD-dependent DNA ligase LigA [Candidatus Bostrichicola ureolyticus]|nr:MAG: NAD-dependent DNA ligase LigA [Candidatus Bostrichicola ureolyticus]